MYVSAKVSKTVFVGVHISKPAEIMARFGPFSSEEIFTIVSRRLHSADLKVEDVCIASNSSGVTGFMGDYLDLQIEVSEIQLNQRYQLQFFVKVMPSTLPECIEYVLGSRGYEKEVMAYSKILPHLTGCLASGKRFASECYLTRPDLIVLENLKYQGFRLYDGLECMDYNHICLVLKALGQMHAASVIFEEENSKIGEIYKEYLFENLFSSIEGNSLCNWFLTGVKTAVYITKFLPQYDDDSLLPMIKKRLPEVCKLIWKLLKPSQKYRNVFCHGDMWNNNIMFCYDSGKPVEVRLVDFQMYRYTPPGVELALFLYLNTRRASREAHLEDFFTIYYDSFSKELQLKGYESGQLLSRTEFQESFERLRDAGRIVAVICLQMCLMPPDYVAPYLSSLGNFRKILEVDRTKEVEDSILRYPLYKARMMEALEELVEFTIFKEQCQK